MVYAFEHQIALPPGLYKSAVKFCATSGRSKYSLEITPSFYDTDKRKTRRAGTLILSSATEENFAGVWVVSDGPSKGTIAAYEDMLAQAGIPDSAEKGTPDSEDYNYYSETFDQHIVGGIRVNETEFAATSVFRTLGRATSEKDLASDILTRQQEAESIIRSLIKTNTYPDVNELLYRDVQDLARAVDPVSFTS